ncbi:MAG: acyl-CoA reductase [Flavobacteriales bacterium]|jgi:hypothetical protein|nr:acyl-CoA reductase [Flavobacteriales bacterium]
MSWSQRINSLVQLGKVLSAVGNQETWTDFELGITEEEYHNLVEKTKTVKHHNGWFTEKEVLFAFESWGKALTKENLELWVSKYTITKDLDKTVAIIMAGNIPMVGFHDLLCVYLLGGKVKAKLSSDDNVLIPAVVKVLNFFDINVEKSIEFIPFKLEGFDAVIATGSNNTARYFDTYFGKYPNIIRKNRTSVAVLTGEETKEELSSLADDVFLYYGLGCRNVTKLYVPKGYDLDAIFGAFFKHDYVSENNKYANNYDYHKAVYLMEQHDMVENGFLLMKEDSSLHSPIGMLFYEEYEKIEEVQKFLTENKSEIQCVVGQNNIPFGKAQTPQLWDYADNIDVIDFLTQL